MERTTLGARLRRAQEELRLMRQEEALRAGGEVQAMQPTRADHARVASMFASARKRVAGIVRLKPYRVSVELGRDGVGATRRQQQGIALLKQACWPMLVPEGIQLRGNVFHRHWQEMLDWAAAEELALSVRQELSPEVAAMRYYLDVRPR